MYQLNPKRRVFRVRAVVIAVLFLSLTMPLSWGQNTPVISSQDVSAATTSEPVTIRVMTFNMLHGGRQAANFGFHLEDFPGSRALHILKVIRESNADIVCLQEPPLGSWLVNDLGGKWYRRGGIISRFPLESKLGQDQLSITEVKLPNGMSIIVANDHWPPTGPNENAYAAQRYLFQHREQATPADIEKAALGDIGQSPRTDFYVRALKRLEPFTKSDQPIVLAGGFEEPSHLDWTARYMQEGQDRWIGNPTGIPLRHKVAWQGSQYLRNAGFQDAYRLRYPDEVSHPGFTWTPPYRDGVPGRRPYEQEIRDRLDRIYLRGRHIELIDVQIMGESPETSDLVYTPWPSDHRAVIVTLRIKP